MFTMSPCDKKLAQMAIGFVGGCALTLLAVHHSRFLFTQLPAEAIAVASNYMAEPASVPVYPFLSKTMSVKSDSILASDSAHLVAIEGLTMENGAFVREANSHIVFDMKEGGAVQRQDLLVINKEDTVMGHDRTQSFVCRRGQDLGCYKITTVTMSDGNSVKSSDQDAFDEARTALYVQDYTTKMDRVADSALAIINDYVKATRITKDADGLHSDLFRDPITVHRAGQASTALGQPTIMVDGREIKQVERTADGHLDSTIIVSETGEISITRMREAGHYMMTHTVSQKTDGSVENTLYVRKKGVDQSAVFELAPGAYTRERMKQYGSIVLQNAARNE